MKKTPIKNISGIIVCLILGTFLSLLIVIDKAEAVAKGKKGEIILNVPIGDMADPDDANSVGMACIEFEASEGDSGYENENCTGNIVTCGDGCDKKLYRKGIKYDHEVPNALLATYIKIIYNYLARIVFILVSVMIIWGGVEWTMSAGNQEAINSGKEKIISALIGLTVFVLAGLILQTINPNIFGAL